MILAGCLTAYRAVGLDQTSFHLLPEFIGILIYISNLPAKPKKVVNTDEIPN